jgi:molybdopterin-guanine dinucleotide biosynthesis protein A
MGGRFKPALTVDGRSIVRRQLEVLRAAAVEHIVLVGRWIVEERPPAPIVFDAVEGAGSLGGLYTALLVAPETGTIVLAGDMPLLTAQLITELLRRRGQTDAVIAATRDGLHPLCGWYSRSVARVFKARIDRGELRIRDAVADIRTHRFDIDECPALDPDGTILMNVNTVADYERACAAARHRD